MRVCWYSFSFAVGPPSAYVYSYVRDVIHLYHSYKQFEFWITFQQNYEFMFICMYMTGFGWGSMDVHLSRYVYMFIRVFNFLYRYSPLLFLLHIVIKPKCILIHATSKYVNEYVMVMGNSVILK